MKIAIISVSKKGLKLSKTLYDKLESDSTVIKTDLYHKNVKKTFPLIFAEYDAVIAIMASGILVRSIEQLIKSKDKDPAVLNIDDNGRFVISILSGHLGGANKLTEKISKLISATPVITTSTDINHKLGIDVLAGDLYLSIDSKDEILYFNKAILEGREISLTINPNKNCTYLFEYLNNNTLEINLSIYYSSKVKASEIIAEVDSHKLVLKERKIVLGIGCRRNKKCEEIYTAFKKALEVLNIHPSRINQIASAEIKSNEKGILDLSSKLNIPVNFVDMDKLELFESPLITKSEFVKSKFGIYSVCEASSLIEAGFDSQLLFKKTSYDGVTIAVSIEVM